MLTETQKPGEWEFWGWCLSNRCRRIIGLTCCHSSKTPSSHSCVRNAAAGVASGAVNIRAIRYFVYVGDAVTAQATSRTPASSDSPHAHSRKLSTPIFVEIYEYGFKPIQLHLRAKRPIQMISARDRQGAHFSTRRARPAKNGYARLMLTTLAASSPRWAKR